MSSKYFGGITLELVDSNSTEYLRVLNSNIRKIQKHDHVNSGLKLNGTTALQSQTMDGSKIIIPRTLTTSKFETDTAALGVQNNNDPLAWKSIINPSTATSAINVNTSDKLEILIPTTNIIITNNTALKWDNSSGTPTSLITYDSSDDLNLSTTIYLETIKPQTDSTYDIGTSSKAIRIGYFSNEVYITSGSLTGSSGSWTPVFTGSVRDPTPVSQTGTYQKFQNFVFATFSITVTPIKFTGELRVEGFPFPFSVPTTGTCIGKIDDSPTLEHLSILRGQAGTTEAVVYNSAMGNPDTDTPFGDTTIKGSILYTTT